MGKVSAGKLFRQFGCRHTQYVLMCLAVVVDFAIRTSMSLAILAIMDPSPTNPNIPTYPEWKHKGTILSAFVWGYAIPQFLVSYLTKYIGQKLLLAISMFCGSIFTMLIPLLASVGGEMGVIVGRFLQGTAQAVLFPCTHSMIGKWAPFVERSKVVSFVYTGGALGNVIAMPIAGIFIKSSHGWPSIFYLYGAVGIVWVIFWMWLAADSPAEHKTISASERELILKDIRSRSTKNFPTPWKSILTCVPFYAILLSEIGHGWGVWTILTQLPSYIHSIMKFNISENSLISTLPFLAMWLFSFVCSPIADFLIKEKYFTVLNVRKLFTSIGLTVPSILLLSLSFVGSDQRDLAVALMILGVGFDAATYSGIMVNEIDIAPNHAGLLMGLVNGMSTITSTAAPLLLDVLNYEETDPRLWQHIFGISAGIVLTGNIIFVVFASSEVQKWDDLGDFDQKASEVIQLE